MACKDGLPVLFPAPAHTKAKHRLYRRYIQAWAPILLQGGYPRVRIVDGFAGPGRYSTGDDGSPLVAIKAVREHTLMPSILRSGGRVRFDFIEECADRLAHLEHELAAISCPPGIEWHTRGGRFDDVFAEVLDKLDDSGEMLEPALVFIDPFGPTGFPMSVVGRVAAYPACEVLINFAWQPLNQWWPSDPSKHAAVDDLFGAGSDWAKGLAITDPAEREGFFIRAYQASLMRQGWSGVSFRLVNAHNQTQYYLVYGTKSAVGMRVFKDAVWSVGAQDGRFQFSDMHNASQLTFFEEVEEQAVIRDLAERIFLSHIGNTVSFATVQETADFHPTARSNHLRKALTQLKSAVEIVDVRNPDGELPRAGSWPEHCQITFATAKTRLL